MNLDINLLRSIVTLVSLILFLGLMAWVWSKRRTTAFEEAALLPFVDEQPLDAPRVETK